MKLIDLVQRQCVTASRQKIRLWITCGRILINGNVARRPDQLVCETDYIVIGPKAAGSEPSFDIIFEDGDVLVVNKPAGLLTSTGPRERRLTLWKLVREYLAQKPVKTVAPGLIHRLDRDASGLLIFAKGEPALRSLKRQFFHHSVGRVYLAVVSPPPKAPSGRLESRLVEWADGTVHPSRRAGVRALTDFQTIEQIDGLALLRVTLQTGRKHQIRVQLAASGCPIVGDTVYGGRENAGGLLLVAIELGFDHPRSGKRMEFRIDPPARFSQAGFMQSPSSPPGRLRVPHENRRRRR